MTATLMLTRAEPFVMRYHPMLEPMTDEECFEFCQLNRDWREEYLANGAQLGWLIDPEERKLYLYRPGSDVVRLVDPESVSGDPVLPGFVLDLAKVW